MLFDTNFRSRAHWYRCIKFLELIDAHWNKKAFTNAVPLTKYQDLSLKMVVPLKLTEPEKFLITTVIPEWLYLIIQGELWKK